MSDLDGETKDERIFSVMKSSIMHNEKDNHFSECEVFVFGSCLKHQYVEHLSQCLKDKIIKSKHCSMVLINDKGYEKHIYKHFSSSNIKIISAFEHECSMSSFENLKNDNEIIITSPYTMLYFVNKNPGLMSLIYSLVFMDGRTIFNEMFLEFEGVILNLPHTTKIFVACDHISFSLCIFCKRYFTKCELHYTSSNMICQNTYFMTFEEKLLFLYQLFLRNDRIVVLTSSCSISKVLYNIFNSMKAFEKCIELIENTDESTIPSSNKKKRILFLSSLCFHQNAPLVSDVYIFFDFPSNIADFNTFFISINIHVSFILIINLVDKNNFAQFCKLKSKFKELFSNEEYPWFNNSLTCEENGILSRLINENQGVLFPQLSEEQENFQNEFESVRKKYQKTIQTEGKFFPELINGKGYYVDKTKHLKYLGFMYQSIYFTRPHRFGKTLNVSMIKAFFECHPKNENTLGLFEGLCVSHDMSMLLHQGKYPVIHLDFSNLGEITSFQVFWNNFMNRIIMEFIRHSYIFDSLTSNERIQYDKYLSKSVSFEESTKCLEFLSRVLTNFHDAKYYGNKTIILIDEYDLPFFVAKNRETLEKVKSYLDSLYTSISRFGECIFASLFFGVHELPFHNIFPENQTVYHSGVREGLVFSDFFGFSEFETNKLFHYYNITNSIEEAKSYYLGYNFRDDQYSNEKLFLNPYSMLKYVDKQLLGNYWHLLGISICQDVGVVELTLNERIVLNNLFGNQDYLVPLSLKDYKFYNKQDNRFLNTISHLLQVGYLTIKNELTQGDPTLYLSIPNKEIQFSFREEYLSWFNVDSWQIGIALNTLFIHADINKILNEMNRITSNNPNFFIKSIKDNEKGYLNYVSGILIYALRSFNVKSMTESTDENFIVIPNMNSYPSYVFQLSVYPSKNMRIRSQNPWKHAELMLESKKTMISLESKNFHCHLPQTTQVFNIALVCCNRKFVACYSKNQEHNYFYASETETVPITE